MSSQHFQKTRSVKQNKAVVVAEVHSHKWLNMGNCRNEMSALYLIQTYCLPSQLYSCETWSLSPCDKKLVDVGVENLQRVLAWKCQTAAVLLLLSSCVHFVTHEETAILEENAM